jgi:hypothetical protein
MLSYLVVIMVAHTTCDELDRHKKKKRKFYEYLVISSVRGIAKMFWKMRMMTPSS